ncbi:hypothetical protein BJX64DRAFT_253395 [Aspergillus heterothallicus]
MPNPIGPCTPLAENIYLHTPPPQTHPTALIILCTWLGGASPRRIAKYTEGYARLFPSASILLITTTIAEISVRGFEAVRRRLEPVRGLVDRFLGDGADVDKDDCGCHGDGDVDGKGKGKGEGEGNARPVLLHIFSHGGSNIATQLVRSLYSSNNDLHARFISALRLVVFDCCPGDSAFVRQYNAAAVSLPSPKHQPIRHLLGKAVLYPSIGLIYLLQNAGIMSSVEDLRAELNDPGLFGKVARRLYVYSVEDEMVRWEDVERHMKEGRASEFLVHGARFERGEHCALVRVDEERYWRVIWRAWGGGARESRL